MHDTEQEQYQAHYLTAEDINVAASLIYQAYHDDPVLQKMLGSGEGALSDYEKKLRALVREELASFWHGKQPLVGLFQGERLKAVACIIQSDSEVQAERYWHWRLKLMLSAGYLTTHQLIEKERTIRKALETMGNYYFLAFIAVDPHFQQQGLGNLLLKGLEDLLVENKEASGIAVFVTKGEHEDFFLHHDYELLQRLEFNNVTGDLMFKKSSHCV